MPYGKGYGKGDDDDRKGSFKAGKPAKAALMIVLGRKRGKKDDDDDMDDYKEPDSLAAIRKKLRRSRR